MPETADRQIEEITEIRLSDYFWILFRNKWSVLFIFLLSVFGAFFVTDLTPPVYQSETTVRVIDGQQQASSLLSQLPLSGLFGGTSLGAYAAQLQSRDLIVAPVVRQLRAEGLLDPLPVHRGRTLVWLANLLNIELDPDATEQGELTGTEWEDFFIKTLVDEELRVEETDGNVITVTVKQRTPERAQQLSNRIVAVFLQTVEAETVENMHWWEKPVPQTMLEQTKRNLKTAEEALFKFQQSHPEITLNAEGGTQAQLILTLQLKENELTSLLVGARLQLVAYEAELESIEQDLVSETITRNPSHAKLRDNLHEYEIERSSLMGKYRDTTHPDITALDEKIKETKARLAQEEKQIRSTTTSYNPLHQAVTEKVNETQATITSLEQQQEEVADQIAAYTAQLGSWSPTQMELLRLKRDVEIYNAQAIALETKMRESEIFAEARTEQLKVLDKARLAEEPVKPRLKLNLVLGAMLGGLLGFTFAVAKNYFKDTYLRLEEAIRQLNSLPEPPSFLGVIPSIKKRRTYRLPLIVHDAPNSRTAEAFRGLQAKLPFLNPNHELKTILVTSATRGEGKSTISANLAVALAQNRFLGGAQVFDAAPAAQTARQVLLIDADMRRPSQHKIFSIDPHHQAEPGTQTDTAEESISDRKPGLSEALLLMNAENGEDVFRATVKPTGIPNVHLVPGGTVPPNPIELLNSEMMRQWLEMAKSAYDVIVIDSPPVRAVADPVILATVADAVVYLFDITKTRRFDMLTSVQHLTEVLPTKNMGVLCNMINPKHAKSYGYYSRHASYHELADEGS